VTAWLGVAVAAVTGYLAIAFLLRMLARTGLSAFGIYCLVFGLFALIVL
jgi:undecaprenyl pyrophosphate phosphatase UppP